MFLKKIDSVKNSARECIPFVIYSAGSSQVSPVRLRSIPAAANCVHRFAGVPVKNLQAKKDVLRQRTHWIDIAVAY